METNVTKGSIKLFVSGSTGKMGQSLSDTLVKKQKEDDPFYEFLEIVSFDFIENKELWGSSVIIDFSEASFSLEMLKQAVTKKILNQPFTLDEHSLIMNETDRTVVGLLWHENVIDLFDYKHSPNETISLYNNTVKLKTHTKKKAK